MLAALGALYWRRRRVAALDGGQGDAGGILEAIGITAQPLADPLEAIGQGEPAPLPESSLFGTALDWVAETAGRVGAIAMSRGYRNNNPGNIRYIADPARAWNGQVGNDAGYGIYDTPANGTRALGRQLLKYASRGLVTVRGIISTWAPANDNNNVAAYVTDVSRSLGVAADDVLNVRGVLPELARAIAKHENGYVAPDYDWQWVYL